MGALSKLRELTSARRSLLPQAVLALAAALLTMRLRSFASVRQILLAEAHPQSSKRHSAADIAWSINAVANRLPGMTCLVQALAARTLLTRYGHGAQIKMGVTGTEDFRAHAWVVSEGHVIVGGPKSPQTYVTLPM